MNTLELSTFDIRNLPLKAPANLKSTPVIDVANAKRWVEAHDGLYHESLRLLVDHVTRISYQTFYHQLGISILSRPLNKKSVVFVEPNKSNLWVAQLAIKQLGIFLKCARLGEKEASYATSPNGLLQQVPFQYWPSEFILFDDAAYSGSQVAGHVIALADVIHKTDKSTNYTIRIIIPFMTSLAAGKLENIKRLSPPNVKIEVSSYAVIPTIQTIFSTHLDLLVLLQQLYKESGYENFFQEETGVGITYFEHKLPNWMSFLSIIVIRYIPHMETPSYIGKMVPTIHEPYKCS